MDLGASFWRFKTDFEDCHIVTMSMYYLKESIDAAQRPPVGN